MTPRAIRLALTLGLGIAIGAFGASLLDAQTQGVKRVALLDTDLAGLEGQQAHLWVGELAAGAQTGTHSHPTTRFVYVLEGAVMLEREGRPPQTFKAGEAFAEPSGDVHNFRNASTTAPARALGFQIARKGQPLQN
jgi:quercetin dioxygenase-like cupin family protein